jgi:2-(3-amino-3-carboxypropyl)histidine synthase
MTEQLIIDAKWDEEIELGDALITHLKEKNIKSIALFASVQFTRLNTAKEQLKNLGIEINITKAKRTSAPLQILGCDAYHDSFEEPIIQDSQAILYIGDGLFHPKALLLSQIKQKEIKPVLIWDPMIRKFSQLTEEDIKPQINRKIRNLKMYINAKTIGIFVTIKPGQQYFNSAKRLKEHLEKENKKAYIFIDDRLSLQEFENYPFIDAWVNTACPRIGTDDIMNTEKPLINIREAGNPTKELDELKQWN